MKTRRAGGGRLRNLAALADLPGALARLHATPTSTGRIDLGPYPIAYVGRPADVRAVLDTRLPGVAERGRFFEEISRVIGPSALVVARGEEHRRLRRLLAPAFRAEQVAGYAQTMVDATEELTAGWVDGAEIELTRAASALTFVIASRALFGLPGSEHLDDFLVVLEEGSRGFYRIVLPRRVSEALWQNRLSRVNRRLYAAQAHLDAFVAELIAARRAEPSPARGERPPNLLDVMLAARDGSGRALADDELRDQVVTFLFAGHETTAQALVWALVQLSANPAVEAALASELGSVLRGRPPRHADLPELGYTRAVVRETLRLFPPAWFLSRETAEPLEVAGCPVPAGALLLASPMALQRDPAHFDRPLRFDPGRWRRLDDAGEAPEAYLPFGWGRHNCIGSVFAQVELALVLASMLRRWRVAVHRPEQVRPKPSVTLRPAGKVSATVRRREGGGDRS